MNQSKLMSVAEIESIAVAFVELGITKIRLTGGEPLLRKDFDEIVYRLSKLKVELLLTTNGTLIDKHIDAILGANISTVNVSLDSLQSETFLQITQRNKFSTVWSNILLLLKNNIRVKINVVAIRGIIEKEIIDFIQLTKKFPLHIRFIEFMPFNGNGWSKEQVITAQQLLDYIHQEYDIIKLKDEPHATAKKYKVVGYKGTIAFITTMSQQFCGECNRLRITAEGKLKNCLFGKEELDLLGTLRKGGSIQPLILHSVKSKYATLGGQLQNNYKIINPATIINRKMVEIGG